MTREKPPIVDAARRCGLMLDVRALRYEGIEAVYPFYGDHGSGKYHLSLNTSTDQYRCNLCGVRGNSVTPYVRLHEIGNKEAYRVLAEGLRIYPMSHSPAPLEAERQPFAPVRRHTTYTIMLEHFVLLDQHRGNLLERGLSKGHTQ